MKTKWEPFIIDNLADVLSGVDIYSKERIPGATPYITSGTADNGIGYFVGNYNKSMDSNVISVARNGAVGMAYYHPYTALFGNDCRRLVLKKHRTPEVQQFIAYCIRKQRKSFSYSRKLGTTRLRNLRIMLPATVNHQPNYDYMEQYVKKHVRYKQKQYIDYADSKLKVLGKIKVITPLKDKSWKAFNAFGDNGLFNIQTTSSSIDKKNLISDNDKSIPYVTRSGGSNGIAQFVSKVNLKQGYDQANVITVGLDTQTAFYQPYKFVTGQNIQIVMGNNLSPYVLQFLVPLLRKQMIAKFNWGGNGATLGRMKRLKILLPVTDAGMPDYDYMEQYIKNMLIKKYKQYLNFAE